MSEELTELQEHAEHAKHDPTLAPISVTMAVLAVLVAVVTCSVTAPTPKRLCFRQSRPINGRSTKPRIFGGTRTSFSSI